MHFSKTTAAFHGSFWLNAGNDLTTTVGLSAYI
jgi:hypothetical protein